MTVATVDLIALTAACSTASLEPSGLVLLKHHATGVYLHQDADIVLRVSRGSDRDRAQNSVALTRWLVSRGFPAIAPANLRQPVNVENVTVTFWRHYPQNSRLAPQPAALGALLRELHDLPSPPVALPRYEPLVRLAAVLAAAPSRLPRADRTWLQYRCDELLASYDRVESELGAGPIHGDAYPGNTLWDGQRAILGDWDEAAYGPRELDLVNTHQGARFGRSDSDRQAFTAMYGWDVTSWAGYGTLRAMRDLHTLAAYVERAEAGDGKAATELHHRVATLRAGNLAATWHAA